MTDFSQYAAVPGTTEFMPDFFLDDFDDFYEGKRKAVDSQAAPKEGIAKVFEQMSGVVNEEMVGKINAVYAFDIKGKIIIVHFVNYIFFSVAFFFAFLGFTQYY